jgi:hypothetical protein
MWYRIFGTNDIDVKPGDLLGHLNAQRYPVRAKFRVDEGGWYEGDIVREDADQTYELQRYLAVEEGIRDDLNTWAAAIEQLETPHKQKMMQHMISTTQLFTLRATDGKADHDFCKRLCQFLAQQTRGLYQVDEMGFFDAQGELLAWEGE